MSLKLIIKYLLKFAQTQLAYKHQTRRTQKVIYLYVMTREFIIKELMIVILQSESYSKVQKRPNSQLKI